MKPRRSGILLHLTSLPSRYGIGDLGPGAYQFADFLTEAGQNIWQILPLTPTSPLSGNSPYTSPSAFAGNTLLISPDRLVEEGFLVPADLEGAPPFEDGRVDYDKSSEFKRSLLQKAFERFVRERPGDPAFSAFCVENSDWLDEVARFEALKERAGGAPWQTWPEPPRRQAAMERLPLGREPAERVLAEKFFQYLFFRQWSAVRDYCRQRHIQIIGDVPIYVSYESADVWANPEIFQLDDDRRPTVVAGVPPDYFSSTGQLWGNPVYRWEVLKETGYDWWVRRMRHNLRLFDAIRLDHFRGFVGYWVVPASETTAVKGRWEPAPARDFFSVLAERLPSLPIIAEDLGVITPDVRKVMAEFGFPGMRVLQFAFTEDLPVNPYAPHNHTRNSVVFTGTHDNNTTRGWFRNELDEEGKRRLSDYLGRGVEDSAVHWELVRLAMMSVADTVVIPMQDLLGLGEEARMNVPSVARGNWGWRVLAEQLSSEVADRMTQLTRLFGRA